MNYLLDLIVIAIIAAVALISARRGFVRVVIELAGFIAAILITLTISTPLASLTYDKIIEPPIVSSVSKATGDSVTQITDDTWNALPEFIRKYSENAGFSKESINKSINENMGNGAVSAAKAASHPGIRKSPYSGMRNTHRRAKPFRPLRNSPSGRHCTRAFLLCK